MAWQLQEAKAKFSELVQKAIDEGPQTVTRRGKEAVVVLSAKSYELMRKRQIEPEGAAASPRSRASWISSANRTMAREIDF